MMGILFIASRFISGVVLGLVVFVLRRNVERQRGLLVELVTVVSLVPLLGVALLISQGPWYYNMLQLCFERALQFVCLALPILSLVGLLRRFRKGESVQLVDLFRLTTGVSLSLFVYLTFENHPSIYGVLAFVVAVLLSDQATDSKVPGRSMALAFCCGLLAAIGAAMIERDESVLALGYFGSQLGNRLSSLRDPLGYWSLTAMIVGAVSTPAIASQALFHSRTLHQLLHTWVAWRLAFTNPLAHMRTSSAAGLWHFRRGTCFLNHGSFGAVPLWVRDRQLALQTEADNQPMDFLARQLEERWLDARFKLATWLGTQAANVAFCENATSGMNEIANWFPLAAGDEVLLNDHEYGAVQRIWQRRCDQSGARLVVMHLPQPFVSREAITQAVLDACTPRTRLVVVSHITSPTAVILPVQEICRQLKDRHIAVCVDGPHALLQEQVHLGRLECDFYTASCHKWLSAPRGSGFLYVAPQWQADITPTRLSWGRLPPTSREHWWDEMVWTGTRDYSAYLSVPEAIRFFQAFDLERVDARNHQLACYARELLLKLPGAEAVTPAGRDWFGWMVAVWLPTGDHASLQQRLSQQHGIEIPVVRFADRFLIRVSCHLYNDTSQIDFLLRSLKEEIAC